MNNAQIKNGDVRIFPYYKGEYMGKSEVEYGFSNEQSARKYMKQIPDEDIYDSIGGYEKYFQENAYLYKYSKTKSYWFNPKDRLDKRIAIGCYDADYTEKFYLKDIPNAEEIKRAIENIDVIIIIGKIAIGRLTARTLVFMDIFTMQKLLNLFIYKLNIFSHPSIH